MSFSPPFFSCRLSRFVVVGRGVVEVVGGEVVVVVVKRGKGPSNFSPRHFRTS